MDFTAIPGVLLVGDTLMIGVGVIEPPNSPDPEEAVSVATIEGMPPPSPLIAGVEVGVFPLLTDPPIPLKVGKGERVRPSIDTVLPTEVDG